MPPKEDKVAEKNESINKTLVQFTKREECTTS